MRKKIVAGNWKMNKTFDEGTALAAEILKNYSPSNNLELILFVPYIHLEIVHEMVYGTEGISVGAQNCHHQMSGAFTGEISAGMIASCGSKYVLIGHSERRMYSGETNELLARKINQCLPQQLQLLYCCGENEQQRDAGIQNEVVKIQIEEGLFHLNEDQIKKVSIAYEPVWAIGTGRNATAEQAQEMHAYIRSLIRQKYGEQTADAMSILYGGSCKPSNASELFAQEDVDGGLIGGASLNAEDFVAILSCLNQ